MVDRNWTGAGAPPIKEKTMTKLIQPAAHIRHKGIMIDASWNKNGAIDYYVVSGSMGRFYSLSVAKEIAEAVANR
jgi:hypothetical protein